jgi:hypothetical protein
MLVTICRLCDSYSDAHRVVLMLESAGLSPSDRAMFGRLVRRFRRYVGHSGFSG